MKKVLLGSLLALACVGAAGEPVKCAPNTTTIVGQNTFGVYAAWWCGPDHLELYAATWDWLTYERKSKLLPLAKKSVPLTTVQAAVTSNVVLPRDDPKIKEIWYPERDSIKAKRPTN